MKRLPLLLIALGLILIGTTKLINKTVTDLKHAQPAYKQTWRLAIPLEITSLDPRLASDSILKGLFSLVFSRLVKIDENFDIKPDILESWSYDLVNKQYTLRLKDKVYFHNKNLLTADDVIFSFHIWARKDSLDSNLLSAIAGIDNFVNKKNNHISGIKKVDNRTITVDLTFSSDNFILTLATPRFFVYPQNFLNKNEASFFQNPTGSGPYQFKETDGKKTLFYLNKNYFEGQPITENIQIETMTPTDALREFESGLIDDLVFYEDVEYKVNNPDVLTRKIESYKVESLVVNTDVFPAFREKKYRDLIKKHIAADTVAEKCYTKENAASHLIPKGLIGSQPQHNYTKSFDAVASDININLLKGLTLYLPDDASATCLLEIMTQNMKALNINVQKISFPEMFKLFMDRKLSLWVEKFSFKNEDPYTTLQYFSNESNEYLIGGKLPILENLFGQLKYTKTLEERSSIYREIDSYLVENSFIVPLVYYPTTIIYRKNIQNLNVAGNRYYIVDWHKVGILK